MSRITEALLLVALLVAVASCGEDPVSATDVAGEYSLRQVNGSEVPAVSWVLDDIYEEVTGGMLALETECAPEPPEGYAGCYAVRVDTRTHHADDTVVDSRVEDRGFWQVDGDGEIEFESDWAAADVWWTGAFSGGAIVVEMTRPHMPIEPDNLIFVP